MIELHFFLPTFFRMAFKTLFTLLAIMHIMLFVAGKTILFQIRVDIARMTVLAGNIFMFAG